MEEVRDMEDTHIFSLVKDCDGYLSMRISDDADYYIFSDELKYRLLNELDNPYILKGDKRNEYSNKISNTNRRK